MCIIFVSIIKVLLLSFLLHFFFCFLLFVFFFSPSKTKNNETIFRGNWAKTMSKMWRFYMSHNKLNWQKLMMIDRIAKIQYKGMCKPDISNPPNLQRPKIHNLPTFGFFFFFSFCSISFLVLLMINRFFFGSKCNVRKKWNSQTHFHGFPIKNIKWYFYFILKKKYIRKPIQAFQVSRFHMWICTMCEFLINTLFTNPKIHKRETNTKRKKNGRYFEYIREYCANGKKGKKRSIGKRERK